MHEGLALGQAATQVAGADLEQLAGDPPARERDVRVVATRQYEVAGGRQLREELAQRGEGLGVGDGLDVVEHDDQRLGLLREPGRERVDDAGPARGRAADEALASAAAAGWAEPRTAPMRWVQRRMASSSYVSSETQQEAGAASPWSQPARAQDLPKPAGAVTSVSGWSRTASSRSCTPRRSMALTGTRGGCVLVGTNVGSVTSTVLPPTPADVLGTWSIPGARGGVPPEPAMTSPRAPGPGNGHARPPRSDARRRACGRWTGRRT